MKAQSPNVSGTAIPEPKLWQKEMSQRCVS